MIKSTPTRILVAVLGFVLAAGAAFALGRWAQSPPETPPAALPTFGSPDPVATGVPVVSDDPWEEGRALAAQAAGSRELASELGITLEASEIVSEPIAAAGSASGSGPTTEPATLDTVAGGTSATSGGTDTEGGTSGEEAPTHPPGDSEEAGERAIDTCAEEDASGSCPEGIGGTILALRDLPDLAGVADFEPFAPGTAPYNFWPECPAVPPAAGTVALGIATNRPALTTVEYQGTSPHLRREAIGLSADWDVFEHTTPDAAEPRWESWVADESAGLDDERYWIDHCVQLTDLEPGDYIARITFTDKYDAAVTHRFLRLVRFSVPDESGDVPRQHRRPTTLVGYGIDTLYVGATRTSEQTLKVVAHENGNGNACDTEGNIDQIFIPLEGRVDGYVIGDTEIASDVLTDPMYPYLPSHSQSVLIKLELTEGTNYAVCVYWVQGDGPSFRRQSVELAEVAFVSTPEAYRPTFRLHGFLNLFGSLEQVDVRANTHGCSTVNVPFEGSFRAERRLAAPIDLCAPQTALTDIALNGVPIRISANEPDEFPIQSARRIRLRLRCTTAPCLIRTNELVLVPLPDVPTERRLCGTGFGSSCDSDIPMRSAGDALVEIIYEGTPGNGATAWNIGDANAFDDSDPPLGETPLIGVSADGAIAGHPTQGALLNVTVRADRPVSLTAEIVGNTAGGEACVLGPVEPYSNDTLQTRHTFTFRDLCLFDQYRVRFSGQDADGRAVAVYDGITRELTTTADLLTPALSIIVEMSARINAPQNGNWHFAMLDHAHITPDLTGTDPTRRSLASGPAGIGWTWGPGDRDIASANGWSMFGVSGRANACGEPWARTLTVNNARIGSWGGYLANTDADISVHIDLFENRPRGGAIVTDCVPGDVVEAVDLRATVTLEELLSGVEITSESGEITFWMRIIRWSAA